MRGMTGIVLLTYGSPRGTGEVPAYLSRIRGGATPSPELIEKFTARYEAIGGSPLIEITRRQATGLERLLNRGASPHRFAVQPGMRFSQPTIAEAVDRLVDGGARRILGIILSPQYSPLIMSGYVNALHAASASAGVEVKVVEQWWDAPRFVGLLADGVRAGLQAFSPRERDSVPVLMTAHSMPKRVVDGEPDYIRQLQATADLVALRAGLARERWHFAYQSAGHTPEEWLKPDMLDLLPRLAAEGHRSVLVAPVQFLADHLETLYDVDIAGRAQAETSGVEVFRRVPAPNDTPDFLQALAEVVHTNLRTWERAAAPRTTDEPYALLVDA